MINEVIHQTVEKFQKAVDEEQAYIDRSIRNGGVGQNYWHRLYYLKEKLRMAKILEEVMLDG